MYTKQSKKMLPLDVLDILQRYTDENHRLSQRDIEKLLAEKYDMVVDRRSVKRSIMDLLEMGFDIEYSETPRVVKDRKTGIDEEQMILSDFYIERDFSDCEIRLLIDELLDSKYIPTRQRSQLISKLEGLSNVYFRRSKAATRRMIEAEGIDNQLFYTLEIIDEAIACNSRVAFLYQNYQVGRNGRIQAEKEEYLVTPHDMQVIDGEYVLFCSDEFSELEFRMDYISDISLLDQKGKTDIDRRPNCGCRKGNVEFVTSEDSISEIVDEFGVKNIHALRKGVELSLVVCTDEKSALDFAIRKSDMVTIVSPESYRNKVMARLKESLGRYSDCAV